MWMCLLRLFYIELCIWFVLDLFLTELFLFLLYIAAFTHTVHTVYWFIVHTEH